jgi:hypothetical protein
MAHMRRQADQEEIFMHSCKETACRLLSDAQREQFVHDGFLKLEGAFSRETAADAREILWRETGFDPVDQKTWTCPVVRLGDFARKPFRQAVNNERLHTAFDEIVGMGRWVPRASLGGFVVRFPHRDDPGDTGWHLDGSFPSDRALESHGSYLEWRINFRSKGRALLMLFLFSDVGEKEAPTRIRVGSHLRVPRLLAPAGEDGMSMLEISRLADSETSDMEETTATGSVGTVYLCHPFLVHAGQRHGGLRPRFLAQPPLHPNVPLELTRIDGNYSLVERAIRLGLNDRRAS